MKQIVLSFVMLFLSILTFSQSVVPDTVHAVRFGFFIGPNYANLYSARALTPNTTIENSFGYSLGIFMEYSISKYFSISPKTELTFNNTSLFYKDVISPARQYLINQTFMEFKGHMIYKIGGSRFFPYLLAGPDLKFLLKGRGTNPDIGIDFGIGFEHYFPKFIFAPELRYSKGLLKTSGFPSDTEVRYDSISLVFNFK